MGMSVRIDSLTPRMLIAVRKKIRTTSSGSLKSWTAPAGRRLKSASPAAAIDTVIVST